ncbi:hypothetical protein F383_10192 [Gossypium arboreum]|uniref:Uncharacterized protein n=1 Tax=Gossypium arboreum TaxID=29729 RepID=A0A0B0NFJ4_GOSAR|nr:hypothetical protein F383_10192 [Gossypium arboreum]
MHTYSSGGSITQGTLVQARSFLYLRSTDHPSGLNPFCNTCRISGHVSHGLSIRFPFQPQSDIYQHVIIKAYIHKSYN